jgi:hypothetical protein
MISLRACRGAGQPDSLPFTLTRIKRDRQRRLSFIQRCLEQDCGRTERQLPATETRGGLPMRVQLFPESVHRVAVPAGLGAVALLLMSTFPALTGPAAAQDLSAADRYAGCVLGTAAVHLHNARAQGDPSIAADGSMFTPEIFVERAWAACESMKPAPEADQDPALQDFVFTSLMSMFFCEQS